MRSLKEFRQNFQLYPMESSMSVKYMRTLNIDFDVFLPSRGKNMQRDYVWSDFQRQEMIVSILLNRHIPHLSFIETCDGVWQVIDGKQRLSSILDFVNDKFPIQLDGQEFYFSDLPEEYKIEITGKQMRIYVLYETYGNLISDDDKFSWFRFLNFAGVQQDIEHLNSLK